MMYLNLVVSVLLAATTVVMANPLVPRYDDDDFFSGFLDALNQAGVTELEAKFAEFGKTPQGQKFIKSLEYDKELTFVAPVNSAIESCSLGDDLYRYFAFSTVYGDVISNKRAKWNSHSKHPSKMRSADLRKRWGANQVQIVDTFIDDKAKRWEDTTIFFNKAVGAAKVLSQSKFRNINIFTLDAVVTVPTRIDDLLCKPLVDKAPYGFKAITEGLKETGQSDVLFNAVRTTLFAPIDSAFEGLEIPHDELAKVLLNHFVPSVVYTTDFPGTRSAKARSGKKLKFRLEGLNAYVSCGKQKANILRRDVAADNGVIHVIDKVLICY